MMSDLLKVGERIKPFVLVTIRGERLHYAQLLRRQRIVLVVLSEHPERGDNGRQWIKDARKAGAGLAERDITVLVMAARPDEISELQGVVGPNTPFILLRDPDKKTIEHLGGTPAFYLIGKDTEIKWAGRTCPKLSELFAFVDSMPMRRKEMDRR